MCDVCVMNAVKDRMLSRRDLFRGGVALAAGGTALATGTAALADGHGSVRDLTHAYDETFPTFFNEPGIAYDQVFNFAEHGFNLFDLTIREHTGTHIDAPLHFSADGRSVDEIEVGNLVVPLCIVDIREKADADPDAQVTPEDLAAWIEANGDIPDRACVAMNSGWTSKVETEAYRGADADGGLHFPGFHPEATAMLLETTSASAMAVDTLSLDHGPSGDFATHYAWLPAGRYGIENLALTDDIPAAGATLVVGAPTHKRGTGGPARIFAMV
ncbi:cyclase family protein [Jannaschia aquimarina]|uniref:KynB protein n=1 Tax=Jannaschia aquimarina TaxID=935700 RepID=A0A0D1EEK5_9RHOB|nr:cyclase family protein [Jannaschia aquimarina]KIT16134.1 Kynurenine formamidase [Jannaschia aquimarina]SNT37305.1 Kynurenine formamidase [Jannaschia aquimarina]